MITVTYNPNSDIATALADRHVQRFVTDLVECNESIGRATAVVSNQLVVDELRLRIVRQEVKASDVKIVYNGSEWSINDYGVMQDNGEDFPDPHLDISHEIITTTIARRNKERNGNDEKA